MSFTYKCIFLITFFKEILTPEPPPLVYAYECIDNPHQYLITSKNFIVFFRNCCSIFYSCFTGLTLFEFFKYKAVYKYILMLLLFKLQILQWGTKQVIYL